MRTNNINISGFLPKDATIKVFEKKVLVLFSIGLTKIEGEGENKEEKAAFIDVKAWFDKDKQHEADFLKKGAIVDIKGFLAVNAWKNAEGVEKTGIVIIAQELKPTVFDKDKKEEQ